MTIDTKHESQRLYYIQLAFFVICVAIESSELLHYHLSHLNIGKLHKMFPNLSILESLECESYQLDNHIHNSFPSKTQNKVKSLFNVIHSDI